MICDLKGSRNIVNREEVQYKIIDMLKEANTRFSLYIASSFLIILGDEWQGLLNYPCNYEEILEFFSQRLGAIEFYCGIGIGEIAIHNFELTINQLDGPAFYKARAAIETAKKGNYRFVLIQ
jgi:hypothetical protein